MALRNVINSAMQARGFTLAVQEESDLWYVRSRAEQWTDVLCFELHSRLEGFTLSFGIEHASFRLRVLAAANTIAPKAYSSIAARPFGINRRPSVITFPAAVQDPSVRVDPTMVDEALLDLINFEYFESVDSDVQYLKFLKCPTGVFDWRRSATAFRLLYIGYLYHSLSMTSAEFAEFSQSIPRKSLEGHALLFRERLTAEDFVDAAIKIIWD